MGRMGEPGGFPSSLSSLASLSSAFPLALGSESGGLRREVIPFRNARRPARRRPVVCNGGFMLSGHFEEMATHGVQAVMAGHSSIGVEPLQ